MMTDSRNMTALDYASSSEDKELLDLVADVMGDRLLKDRPKSLKEIEEEARMNGLAYLNDQAKPIDRMYE